MLLNAFDWLLRRTHNTMLPDVFARSNESRLRIAYFGWECADPVIVGELDWLSVEMLAAGSDVGGRHAQLSVTWNPRVLRLLGADTLPLAKRSDGCIVFAAGTWDRAAAARLTFAVSAMTTPLTIRWEMSNSSGRRARADQIVFVAGPDVSVQQRHHPRIGVTPLGSDLFRTDFRAGGVADTRQIVRGETCWVPAQPPTDASPAIREMSSSEYL